MESFFSRYKNALVLVMVLFAQVIGVAIQVRRPLPKEHAQPDAGGVRLIRYWAISLVSPPERLVHWMGSSILGVWDNYVDLIHVRRQNSDLQSELHRLRLEQGSMVEDARQGQRLQQLLGFEEKYVYKTLPAQIIGTSGTEQSRILSIDKGAKDGLAVDMPVITPDGIVGRIREVFPHTSQVLEISDPTSGAGVILATTRIRGILRGSAMGQPQVVSVMPDDRIKAGEPVVTSGGDQIFPRGLAVGVVDRVVADPDHDPMVDVVIHPAANLSRLEEVLVITNMGEQVTPRQKLDMIQSEAAATAEQMKASEILAERLPSRIDPDAPKSQDESADNSDGAAGDGGVARPMRPPSALHPDRFTPNTTPAAASLTPGARLAPQAEGQGNAAVKVTKPHPPASTDSGDATKSATIAPKKKPELVPEDGSRPAATITPRPAVPASDSGDADAIPHIATPRTPAETTPARPRPSTDEAATPATHAAGPPDSSAPTASPVAPKTKVIVDGPLPSSAKKTAPSAPGAATAQRPSAAPASQQHPSATPGQSQPKTATPSQSKPTGPAQSKPAGQTQAKPATPTQPKPATPAQHKGPVLVPDDGSRPPPSMLTKPPAQQPQPSAPQGGRGQ